MPNRNRGYISRRVTRRNSRSNFNNNNDRSNNNNNNNSNHTVSILSLIQNIISNQLQQQQQYYLPLELLLSDDDNDNDNNNNDREPVLEETSDNNEEITIFNTSTTIPRPVTKNINTVVFDLHGVDLALPIVFLFLENQYGSNEIISITNLHPPIKYCSTLCLVIEVLFASEASIEKAINHQGLKIGNLQILGSPVINTIHYKDIFKYQENDFDSSLSLVHWSNQYNPYSTKCTVYTLFNLPMKNDVTNTIHNIKDSIIYMENWLKLKKNDHPSFMSSNDSNNNGFYGPVSIIPSVDSPFIGVFPVRYPGTHIRKNAYFVVVHDHMMNYSVFQNSTSSSSLSNCSSFNRSSSSNTRHNHNRYHGKSSARLICFDNDIFFYDRTTFDRTFCFHCKEPDCHFTEDCPLDDVIDNFRSLCVHQLSN